MKLKRILTMCLAAVLLLTASGCQLAKEDLGADETSPDRLIGVFATEEYLDLFDIEGYLNDNLDKINVGGNTVIDGDQSAYEGRLYATLTKQTLTSEETGETREHYEYVFEGVEGYRFFLPTITDPKTGESYNSTNNDDAISDVQVALKYGDEENITLEGTIYYPITMDNGSYNLDAVYINPVYQSADGSVYAKAGSGSSSSGNVGTGGKFTHTLSESMTVTSEDGTEKTISASIIFSVASMFAPEKIAVVQFDADSAIVSRTEYEPGTLPETLIVEETTEYIIVETQAKDENGEPVVSREMYSSDDSSTTSFTTFYCREDGICVQKYTNLDWGN